MSNNNRTSMKAPDEHSSSSSSAAAAAADSNSNFHVCVRIRPTSSASYENQGHSEQSKYIRAGPENSILFVQPHSTQGDKVFIFDEVFDSRSRTKQIFEKVVKPNLDNSLFKGFSHTILVYGMTGSGKTFTMFGDGNTVPVSEPTVSTVSVSLSGAGEAKSQQQNTRESNNSTESSEVDGPLQQRKSEAADSSDLDKSGLVNETVKLILSQTGDSKMKTKVKMSYLEIYNEQIRDLLSNDSNSSDNLMILEDPDKGVYCPLLSERDISTLDQIQVLIKQGNKRRVMASTKLNEFSSRSHAIIQLSLEIEIESNDKTSTYFTPKLYMVDLAGCERASATESKGLRLKEGANINKSLLSLGNCITVLSSPDKKKRHVPYRDSKLTRLLKESLGGNAKTLLIACVTPAFRFVEETINTLKYAQRAKSIHKDVYENIKQIYNQIEKSEEVDENGLQMLPGGISAQMDNMRAMMLIGSGGDASLNVDGVLAPANVISALEGDFDEAELQKRLQILQGAPPTQDQVLKSTQYLSHREKFKEQFQKLSEHFEDILYRNRELECNLAEFIQAKEQNEKLINEILDTITPNQGATAATTTTQKDAKYRLDKVAMLQKMVKNNEDVIVKLQRELKENDVVKSTIKTQIESLYEVKFIRDCQGMTNMQLYTSFETEKNQLKSQIDTLADEKQRRRMKELEKEAEIINLKDQIQFLKRKAQENEMLLQQQVGDVGAAKNKSRGRSTKRQQTVNLRGSALIATATNNQKTPRNGSQSRQFTTFAAGTSGSTRNKSVNLRASMYSIPSANALGGGGSGAGEHSMTMVQTMTHMGGIQSMTDVQSMVNHNRQSEFSPEDLHTKEFEEYKRKEHIIETQLKNVNKNTSQKNVKSAMQSQQTSGQQANLFKSSFKSSFVDSGSNHFTTTTNSQTLIPIPTAGVYDCNNGSETTSNYTSNTAFGGNTNTNKNASELATYSRFVGVKDEGEHSTFGEMFQPKPFIQTSTSGVTSPKSKAKGLSGSGIMYSATNSGMNFTTNQQKAKHTKNLSFSDQTEDKKYNYSNFSNNNTSNSSMSAALELIGAPPSYKVQQEVCYAIPESAMEQSMMNMSNAQAIEYTKPSLPTTTGLSTFSSSNMNRRSNNSDQVFGSSSVVSGGATANRSSYQPSGNGSLQRNLSPSNRFSAASSIGASKQGSSQKIPQNSQPYQPAFNSGYKPAYQQFPSVEPPPTQLRGSDLGGQQLNTIGQQQQQQQQPASQKVVNPSFNSYMQNKDPYGQPQQRVVQVPTTAISLDFNSSK